MASNYTGHYQLPIWAPEDSFLREEFNETNQKIENALGAIAQAMGNCRIVTGSYTGTGEYGSAHPNTLTFDGPPVAVMVGGNWQFWALRGFIRASTASSGESPQSVALDWTEENAISWYSDRDAIRQMNSAGNTYYYLALLATDS